MAGSVRLDARVYWGTPGEDEHFYSPWNYLMPDDLVGLDPVYDLSLGPYQMGQRMMQQQNTVLEAGSFSLFFNTADWNSLITASYVPVAYQANMNNLLLQELEGTAFEGRPYFIKYFADSSVGDDTDGLLQSDPRMLGATENVPPLMEGVISTVGNPNWLWDHTFSQLRRDRGGTETEYNIEINPIYNYYLDTSPDYELGITDLPESMLPNYYMLEVNYALAPANDGSIPYENQASLAQTEVGSPVLNELATLFTETSQPAPASTAGLSTGPGYFQYYLNLVQSIEHEDQLASVEDTFTSTYRNVAVLSPEISAGFLADYNVVVRRDRGSVETEDDLLAVTSYPFYNKITIPHSNQYPVGSNTFFEETIDGSSQEAAEQFLTLMQLYIIYSYTNPDASGSTGRTALPFALSDSNGTPSNLIHRNQQSIDMLINLEGFLDNLYNSGPNSPFTSFINDLMDYYDGATSPSTDYNLSILREGNINFKVAADGPFVDSYFESFASNKEEVVEAAALAAANRFRGFREFFRGLNTTEYQRCKSETFMYMVEKRVASDLGDQGPVVQTLFFGRDIINTNPKGVVYYDTQIKYGVKYSYNIKQIRLVFGNKYKYAFQTATVVNDNARQQGRAVGNALGFFAPERALYTTTESFMGMAQGDTANWQGLTPPSINNATGSSAAYIPEGEDSLARPMSTGHAGYYPYRWHRQTGKTRGLSGLNVGGGPAPASYTNAEAASAGVFNWLGSQENNIQTNNTDWTQIPLGVKVGEGFDGYRSGGLIPAPSILTALPPEAEPPPPEPPPDYGTVDYQRIYDLQHGAAYLSSNYGIALTEVTDRRSELLDIIASLFGVDARVTTHLWLITEAWADEGIDSGFEGWGEGSGWSNEQIEAINDWFAVRALIYDITAASLEYDLDGNLTGELRVNYLQFITTAFNDLGISW